MPWLPSPDGPSLLSFFQKLSNIPGGKRLFSRAIGQAAPYTGTLGALVEVLEPGFARLSLEDRRAIRNHLGSVHAIALANLAEETTGLAVLSGTPKGTRGIVTEISIEYRKKARGRLIAECRTEPFSEVPTEKRTLEATADIRDASGEVVCRGRARWQIGPEKR